MAVLLLSGLFDVSVRAETGWELPGARPVETGVEQGDYREEEDEAQQKHLPIAR